MASRPQIPVTRVRPWDWLAAAYVLWTQFLKHNPNNPGWVDRDRFVLSGGHASMLLYSLLFLTGYKVGLNDLKNFRQWGSITPGHPEYGHTPGVETTTGPLGQGFSQRRGHGHGRAAPGCNFQQRQSADCRSLHLYHVR